MSSTLPGHNWQVNASDPLALTRLLTLPGFVVQTLGDDERLDCLVVRCEHAHDSARCPTCGTLSAHPHRYEPRTLQDGTPLMP
jgi:hypothetical protein